MDGQRAASVAAGQHSFGGRLRALREAAGYTQEELAERAGLTAHGVSALERGARTRPYPHTIRALGDALGVSEQELALLRDAVPRRQRPGTSRAVAEQPDGYAARSLPVATTGLIGRERELAELSAMLRRREARLVTLTGTGGVGKTRLSVAVTDTVADAFLDGTTFVPLAAVSDASLVLPAIAQAVGLGATTGPNVETQVADHLRTLRQLLVLDNFEHLPAAAPAVARLVAGCPGLSVLVSSRAPLRVTGECEFPVPPLGLPPAHDPDAAAVTASPAGALLLARAVAVTPRFAVTHGNAGALAAICHRLAGIPLAVELAAARLRFLPPEALLARLDDALSLGGARDLPARQRTMRATIDWSYGLLTEGQQRLLRRLAVFAGGFTLDAAEVIGAGTDAAAPVPGPTESVEVLGLLEALVEQSLVTVTPDHDQPRYSMLEPIAQYARTLLAGSVEAAKVRHGHAAYYLAFAEQAESHFAHADQLEWLHRVESDNANLIAAIEWALANGHPDVAGRMGWALWLYWYLRGQLQVRRPAMEAVLEHDLPDAVRVRVLIITGNMAAGAGAMDRAGRRWREALDLAQGTDDHAGEASARFGVAIAALQAGDLRTAEDMLRASSAIAAALGGDGQWLYTHTRIWSGTARMVDGDPVGALPHFADGLSAARQRGDRLTTCIALHNLAGAAIATGDLDLAGQHLREGTRLCQETGDLANLAYYLDALAVVDAGRGDAKRVATLLGAAQSLRE
ncbi:MAG TPA: helix-turn-helix domain-containing protein, partial [Pilimelia sp.]|nr:helix-turn-helix domain-containing protein [Pilimelia sp.]